LKTWIKFCGTTSLEDALASVEAGADALGFIFAPSKRRISTEKAQEIIRALPPAVERIGVFLNEAGEQIRKTLLAVGLTGVQLHGGEFSTELYSQFHSLRKIKTILVDDGFEERLDSAMAANEAADAWLLDSGAGSGKTFDWHTARRHMGQRQGRFIIAGGLSPENVGDAIRTFSPWGVDVVSGIEREPGRKDPAKLKAFVAAVRRAERQ
jgi:phosphoribosylanthranilate isomerase